LPAEGIECIGQGRNDSDSREMLVLDLHSQVLGCVMLGCAEAQRL
jgi:hypothetical protein